MPRNLRNLQKMSTRKYTGKGGETWEWEETPETTKALKNLHKVSKEVPEKKDYQGPLYAPHPSLIKKLKEQDDKNNYDTNSK